MAKRKTKKGDKRLFAVTVRREFEFSEAEIHALAYTERGAREAARKEATKHADQYFGGCASIYDHDCEEIDDTECTYVEANC